MPNSSKVTSAFAELVDDVDLTGLGDLYVAEYNAAAAKWKVRPSVEFVVKTSDSNAAAQALLDAATAAGGGVVRFPRGSWDVSTSLAAGTGVVIRGSGYGTVLRLANGANTHLIKSK